MLSLVHAYQADGFTCSILDRSLAYANILATE